MGMGVLPDQDLSIAQSFHMDITDAIALLVFTTLVFMQQSGFASLEAGSVQVRNLYNILLHNIVDKLVCGIGWFIVGFAFAYGKSARGVIGYSHFALTDQSLEVLLLWFFSLNFLLTSCTIVSGALAERACVEAYVAYAAVMSTIIYPMTQHWTQTWLTWILPCRYLDFAGGSTVHLIGGVAALVGSIVIKPRLGRFCNGEAKQICGHNIELVAAGSLQLWFGWYGFNIAPSFLQGNDRTGIAARAAVNTTLSICASALATLVFVYFRTHKLDLRATVNGILAGAVAITALTAHIEPWCAVVIGVLGGGTYVLGVRALEYFRVDDPLDASVVHGLCSLVGLLGAGIFVKAEYIEQYRPGQIGICNGVIYSPRRGGMQLAVQLVGVLVITCFSGAVSSVLFGGLHYAGFLRASQNFQRAGLDLMEGAEAYPYFQLKNVAGGSGGTEVQETASHHVPAQAVPNLEDGQDAASRFTSLQIA